MTKGVTVDFNANLARFSSSIDKATNDLNKFQSNASRIGGNINKVFSSLGIGLSVSLFANFVKGAIDAEDKMGDLAKTTKLTVETIAGLELASRQSGGDLDSIADAIAKLSVNIGKNRAEMTALGITATDPLEAFKQLADILNSTTDTFDRDAIAAKAIGKSWQGAAPLLAEGGKKIGELVEKGTRLSGITKESQERADALNDKLEELSVATRKYGVAIGEAVIPPMLRWLELIDKADGKSATLADKMKAIATFMAPGIALPIIASLDNDPEKRDGKTQSGKIRKAGDSGAADAAALDRAKRNCEFLGGKWNGKVCIPKSDANKGPTDDPRKKLLDNSLKNLEDSISKERDLLESRNSMLDYFNSQGLISIKSYYDAKADAQNEALVKELAALDQEIALLEAHQKKTNKTGRAEDQGKIDEILAKKAKLEQEANENSLKLAFDQAKATKEYGDAIQRVNAQVLELSGNLSEAALIRFDQENADTKARFTAEGNTAALRQLEILRNYTAVQADATRVDRDSAGVLDDLDRKERRIELARQQGSLSEIGALRAVDEARGESVAALQDLVAEYSRLAEASGNPQLIRDAENLKVKLEELEATSHQVADKFSKLFEDSAASAFEEFINGTKSAKDAFLSFADSVVAQINRMAAQSLAQELFGGFFSGGGGGGDLIGSIVGSIFGGGKSSGGGNASPGIQLPKFADGTDFVPHDMVAMIHKGEKITPAKYNNNKPNGSINVVNHFIVSGPTDQRSQQQIATQAYGGIMKAMRRYG